MAPRLESVLRVNPNVQECTQLHSGALLCMYSSAYRGSWCGSSPFWSVLGEGGSGRRGAPTAKLCGTNTPLFLSAVVIPLLCHRRKMIPNCIRNAATHSSRRNVSDARDGDVVQRMTSNSLYYVPCHGLVT